MKTLTKKFLEKELAESIESNETIKAAASMVGFDVDKETETAKASMDNRVKINMYQTSRINILKSLIGVL